MRCRFALILLLLPLGICAQQRAPFVGCPSDGQAGPVDPPTGKGPIVKGASATGLSYYRGTMGFGVLAPRGWHCFGVYGSSGDALLIAPWVIDSATAMQLSSHPRTGPLVAISLDYRDGSGRYGVAALVNRVFPAYRNSMKEVFEEFPDLNSPSTSGPYPADRLTYKSDNLVEYMTPGMARGLGLQLWLQADENPIQGVAMLTAQNAIVLSVRLPASLRHLAPTIIHQVELDAAKPPSN